MTAYLIPTASEEEWLAARRTGITASEIAVVLGLSPYSSPYKLFHQKLGNLPPDEESDAMALGKHMESFVAAKFAERHPEFLVRGDGRELYAHPARKWQMATPDRLVFESGECPDCGQACCPWHEQVLAVLECKIDGGSDEWGEDGSDEIPVHYRAQVLWQMDVMGVDNAYVACLLWNKRKVRVYEIYRDTCATQDLKLMREAAEDFLGRLECGDEPDVDWRPATTLALKALHPDVEDRDVPIPRTLAARYRAACRSYDKAEQRKKLTENLIRARLGSGRRAITGNQPEHIEIIARRDVYDVREHTRKASHIDRLVQVKPKGEKS